jgi:hypothetical protein
VCASGNGHRTEANITWLGPLPAGMLGAGWLLVSLLAAGAVASAGTAVGFPLPDGLQLWEVPPHRATVFLFSPYSLTHASYKPPARPHVRQRWLQRWLWSVWVCGCAAAAVDSVGGNGGDG